MESWAVDDAARRWMDAFAALPEAVQEAVSQRARTPCPDCARRGVPQSWAVAAAHAARP